VLMATLVRPTLLLLDEHIAALDPRSAEQVTRLTQDAIAVGGLTTLMVTHSMAQAVLLADRVLVMHRGRVAYDLGEVRRGRLTEDDLLQLFDQLRWADRLDDSAAEMLRRTYV
jgi:putative ABC transport system ATP-binding protein